MTARMTNSHTNDVQGTGKGEQGQQGLDTCLKPLGKMRLHPEWWAWRATTSRMSNRASRCRCCISESLVCFFIYIFQFFFSYFLYRFTWMHPTTNTTTLGMPKVTSNATKWQQQQWQWQQQQGLETQICLKAGMYLLKISFILLIVNVTDYRVHVPPQQCQRRKKKNPKKQETMEMRPPPLPALGTVGRWLNDNPPPSTGHNAHDKRCYKDKECDMGQNRMVG